MAAGNFPHPILAFTLGCEGGDVDDPRDPGGATRNGITQATYDAWRRGRGQPLRSVFTMEAAERDAVYRARFWDAVGGDVLAPGPDLAAFDFAVNSGPARARAALTACTGLAPPEAVGRICAIRRSFVTGLRSFAVFGRGWQARIAACEALALRLAHGEAPSVAGSALTRAAATARRASAGHAGAAGVLVGGSGALPLSGLSAAWLAGLALAAAVLAAALVWRSHLHALRAAAFAAEAAHL